jgi:hypothetical protein
VSAVGACPESRTYSQITVSNGQYWKLTFRQFCYLICDDTLPLVISLKKKKKKRKEKKISSRSQAGSSIVFGSLVSLISLNLEWPAVFAFVTLTFLKSTVSRLVLEAFWHNKMFHTHLCISCSWSPWPFLQRSLVPFCWQY